MSTGGAKAWPKMTGPDEFRFLADLVLKHSTGDHTFVALHDQHGGTARFANNQIVQNVNSRRGSFNVTVAYGQQHGTAGTTDFTAGGVQDALKRAEQIARVSPDDPEYLPPVGPQRYPAAPAHRPETAAAGPGRRLEYANEAIGQCRMENLQAAGIVASAVSAFGVAASTGLFAHEERTDARFSITVQAGEATGWASAAHRSIDHLKVQERTLAAIQKAKRGGEPGELPAGRYTVVLEPAAVAGLVSSLAWMLDAKAYDAGTSPFSGRLGRLVVDKRLHLRNMPAHEDLFGVSFTAEGLPTFESRWIDGGVLTQLAYDRFTAKRHGVEQIPTLEAPYLSWEGTPAANVQELVRGTRRGILVSNFWYIRTVNPIDLTLTGMTRDGTFLIEDGEVTTAVKNFRFHDSPLRAFSHIDAGTGPAEAVTSETGKWLVPALRVQEFNFSSATRF